MRKKLVVFFWSILLLGAVLLFSGFTTPSVSAAMVGETSVTTGAVTHASACPTLSEGSSGSFVRVLQSKLNYLYERYSDPRWFLNSPDNFRPPLAVDGSFGFLTRNAVIDYQYWNGLQVDGIVGPQTWGSLGGC